jgi:hypothetical protein
VERDVVSKPSRKEWIQMKRTASRKEILMKRLRRVLAVLVASGALAAGVLAAIAGPASADYGPGALYQVEITSNESGPNGGGIWLWIALYPSGGSTTSGIATTRGQIAAMGMEQLATSAM